MSKHSLAPKLSVQLPNHLPSLEKLVIKNCEQLVVSFSSIPMLCELEIDGCRGMACNSRIRSLSLNSVTLSNILEFDDWLRQENFQKLECLNMKNMGCEALMNMWQLNESLGKQPLQEIQSITFLREQYIENCSNLVSFPQIRLLSNLSKLEIKNCNALMSLPVGMEHNTHVESVKIKGCDSITFIRGKYYIFFNALTAQTEYQQQKHISSRVYSCPQLPSSHLLIIKRSVTYDTQKAIEIEGGLLVEWGLHNLTSLTYPKIFGSPDAESFPQQDMGMMLPHSLTHLCIERFPKLKYLWFQALQNLTSLEILRITSCPNITFFPEYGLPSSLLRLQIRDCPLLEKQCRRDNGKVRSIISHIPCVEIDFKFIGDDTEEEK
ncbi:hypothetical protein Ddye_011293 [Dipteronia dyeriana]|uniref:Uncharacterized protein n=1 Tax=Dipteronia dyeriana TaxID=168575 RepID=A0AAD9X293_9ROSI|nr:hypothetical protein Ddye_011293 [Dipteronia dyeriana]